MIQNKVSSEQFSFSMPIWRKSEPFYFFGILRSDTRHKSRLSHVFYAIMEDN